MPACRLVLGRDSRCRALLCQRIGIALGFSSAGLWNERCFRSSEGRCQKEDLGRTTAVGVLAALNWIMTRLSKQVNTQTTGATYAPAAASLGFSSSAAASAEDRT